MLKILAVVSIVIGAVPIVFALAYLLLMWRVWWLYPAWEWFFVPLGLPPITFWHLAGLLVLVEVTTRPTPKTAKNDEKDWQQFFTGILTPPFAWLIFWAIQNYAR